MPDGKSPRRSVNIPVVLQKVSGEPVALDHALEPVFERVVPDSDDLGARFPGVITELASNGAFIAGPALPLLSRVVLSFSLPGAEEARAVAWVMWRRTQTVAVSARLGGGPVDALAGCGVLFEHVSTATQRAIAAMF